MTKIAVGRQGRGTRPGYEGRDDRRCRRAGSDLSNEPGGSLTPEAFADKAKEVGGRPG